MRILASEPEASKCLIVCVVVYVTLYVHIRSIGGGAFPHPRLIQNLYFNIYNYIRLDDLPVLVTLVVSISIINLL